MPNQVLLTFMIFEVLQVGGLSSWSKLVLNVLGGWSVHGECGYEYSVRTSHNGRTGALQRPVEGHTGVASCQVNPRGCGN